MTEGHTPDLIERGAIIAYLDRMKVEASELGQPGAVFWIVQIKRDIERGEHLASLKARAIP